jgi:acylphosphatase
MNKVRLKVLYSGHVQGVGFRYTVKSIAPGYELCGTIRNLDDGRVELICEGDKDELLAFCEAIRNSGLGRFIRSEDMQWQEAKNDLKGFSIIG